MSSDVRRTTISEWLVDQCCAAAYSACDMGSFPTAAVDPESDRRFIRAAIEYDRTRPPEAARSPDLTGSGTAADEFSGFSFPIRDASPSPDPRGPDIYKPDLADDGRRTKDFLLEVIAAQAEPPAAPATTGARAEAVEEWVMVPRQYTDTQLEHGIAQLNQVQKSLGKFASDETICGVIYDGMVAARNYPTAPPEVTHGAAIGGDVVTVYRDVPPTVINGMLGSGSV